jgi:hypothetical protein
MRNLCELISGMMIDYINENLSDSQKVMFLSHIASCEICRSDLTSLIALKKATIISEQRIPETLSKEIFRNIINNVENDYECHRETKNIGCEIADIICYSTENTLCNILNCLLSVIPCSSIISKYSYNFISK